VFARDTDRVECQLRLDADHLLYEFVVRRISSTCSTCIDRFTSVSRAFERQGAYEALLIADGWTLESFESTFVPAEPNTHP
jgi:hypothetical protein